MLFLEMLKKKNKHQKTHIENSDLLFCVCNLETKKIKQVHCIWKMDLESKSKQHEQQQLL